MARNGVMAGAGGNSRLRLRWWHGLVAAGLAGLLPGPALLLLASSPVVALAWAAERDTSRRITRAVILFSLAGLVAPADTLLRAGYDVAAALRVIGQGAMVRVWAAGGIGWAASELAALVGTVTTHLEAARRRRRLADQITALREEWEFPETDG